METPTTVLSRISELVEGHRKTPTGFAKMVGIDPAGFMRMMRGELNVTDKTLKKISDACGVRFSWLLSGDGEKYAPAVGLQHQSACEVEGGNAQALGDGSSATVNPNPADLIAIIARYQTQIEQMQAEARAERERLLSEARAERERLYSLLERIKNS